MMNVKITTKMEGDKSPTLTNNKQVADLNPKELLLYATAQCTGITLHSILEKERICPKSLEIEVSGALDTETVTARSIYTSFNVAFRIECSTMDEQAKIGRAIRLTTERYCGMIQMLRRIAPLSHEVSIVSIETVEA